MTRDEGSSFRKEIGEVGQARDGVTAQVLEMEKDQEQVLKGMGDGKGESTGEARVAAEANTRFHLPTPEEMVVQDLFNNCAVRTVMSGVMGIHSPPSLTKSGV